jgi:hypothetical protein
MDINTKLKEFMDKVKKIERGEKLDLSSDEDLSIAIMNLVAIEEHLFFSGEKTGKTRYFQLLNEVREMRKQLLKKLIKDYEGEVWCISKHLLAASMRLLEVGTKALSKGEKEQAEDLFKKSYNLYNLFWGVNLGMVKKEELKTINIEEKEKPIDFFGKINQFISKILDCCKE